MPRRSFGLSVAAVCILTATASPARELWVAPTHKQDTEVAKRLATYPVTAFGVARFGFSIPEDMVSFTRAVVVVIPVRDAAGTFHVVGAATADGEVITNNIQTLLDQPLVVTGGQLLEVDVTTLFQSLLDGDSAGADYVGAIFWTSSAWTDSVLGLRFTYEGSGGVSCWDTNENFSCDLTEEDINNDGRCDALDCIGPPVVHTIAICDDDPDLRQVCSDLCAGPVVAEVNGQCAVTSDTGSCTASGQCCVCEP